MGVVGPLGSDRPLRVPAPLRRRTMVRTGTVETVRSCTRRGRWGGLARGLGGGFTFRTWSGLGWRRMSRRATLLLNRWYPRVSRTCHWKVRMPDMSRSSHGSRIVTVSPWERRPDTYSIHGRRSRTVRMMDLPWWSFLNMVSRTSTVWAASTDRLRMRCRPTPASVQKLSVSGTSEDWTMLR